MLLHEIPNQLQWLEEELDHEEREDGLLNDCLSWRSVCFSRMVDADEDEKRKKNSTRWSMIISLLLLFFCVLCLEFVIVFAFLISDCV